MKPVEIELSRLSTNEWEELARIAQHEGPCVISLEQVDFARPSGIIALTLCSRYRRHYTNVLLPQKGSAALGHLTRIGFLRLGYLFSVRFDRPVRRLIKPQEGSDTFTEILRLDDPDYDRAYSVVREHLRRRFPSSFRQSWTAFTEVLENIRHHSDLNDQHLADHVIQVQGFRDKLELAFGDLGIGFLQSLHRNPKYRVVDTEQEALKKVVFEKASGLSHRPGYEHRGGGLRKAVDAIHELGGAFKLVSGDGQLYRVASRGDRFHSGGMPMRFPGTLMAIQIPFP